MAVKGQGEFYSCDGNGNIALLKRHFGWRAEWTQIVPGNFGGRSKYTDLLFYDNGTGEGEFYVADGRGNINLQKLHQGWRKTWDIIVPGNFGRGGRTDLLFYDASAGEGEFCTTDGRGNITLQKRHQDWRKTWDMIIPGNFGGSGRTDLLFYDRDAGEGEFCTTDGQGNITLQKRHQGWRRTWNMIIPGDFGSGHTGLLFYDRNAGEGEFYTTDGQGDIALQKRHRWRKTWSIIIPGNFGGSGYTDLLFYDVNVGDGEFCTTDGQGNITRLKLHHRWRETWDMIIPGNFGGSDYTDILFYDSRRVLISSQELRNFITNQLANKIAREFHIYLADGTYYCSRREDIDRIVRANQVDHERWVTQKHDCDDFAHRLKGAFILDAYLDGVRRFPHACGILWGRSLKEGHHAINVVVTSEMELFFIEPQTDAVFAPRDEDDEIYFVLA